MLNILNYVMAFDGNIYLQDSEKKRFNVKTY